MENSPTMVKKSKQLEIHPQKVKVSNDFYLEFPTHIQNHITQKAQCRLKKLCEKHFLPVESTTLQSVFTDIFSWSVLPFTVLQNIEQLLLSHGGIDTIVDLCCGNAFHTYLFSTLTCFSTYTGDIQEELHSWMPIQVEDARTAIYKVSHIHSALLLSWIDYQELGIYLVREFTGPIIISLGNYADKSPLYIEALQTDFKLIASYHLHMPWERVEMVEIYSRV